MLSSSLHGVCSAVLFHTSQTATTLLSGASSSSNGLLQLWMQLETASIIEGAKQQHVLSTHAARNPKHAKVRTTAAHSSYCWLHLPNVQTVDYEACVSVELHCQHQQSAQVMKTSCSMTHWPHCCPFCMCQSSNSTITCFWVRPQSFSWHQCCIQVLMTPCTHASHCLRCPLRISHLVISNTWAPKLTHIIANWPQRHLLM